MKPAIEIKDLVHPLTRTAGLFGVNLTVPTGNFLLLAGANGSGKTTLLKHLNGLLLPKKGSVRIFGKEVSRDILFARTKVGMVFQDADHQIVGETVWEDVVFGPENLCLSRDEIKQRGKTALREMELEGLSAKRPYDLSGGEKRRLALAGVLAMHPDIIVMDEPFSNLDYPGVCALRQKLLDLKQQGRTIVLSTHGLENALDLADRLVFIKDGKVAASGTPGEVMGLAARFSVRPVTSYVSAG